MSQVLNGIAAGGGITIAPVYVLGAASLSASLKVSDNENHEAERLRDSFSLTRNDLVQLGRQAKQELGHDIVTIQTQLTILDDPQVRKKVAGLIKENHWTADWAVQMTMHDLARVSTLAVSSPYWAATVEDLGQRLLSHLLNRPIPDTEDLDHRAIIIAHKINPTQVIRLDRQLVAGLVTDSGGPTSHFSLLSEELAIPAVVGTEDATKFAHNDMVAIIDGIHGRVILQPSPQEIDKYQQMAGEYARRSDKLGSLKNQPTVSADGHQVRIAANLSLPSEVKNILGSGAEGVGLFRTEFMEMENGHLASENQQFNTYKRVITAMPNEPVVVRTLDVGNDKLLGEMSNDRQTNPALGLRAIRISLTDEKTFRPQIRALLRASTYGKMLIMFPLITTLDEFIKARKIVDEEQANLTKEGYQVAADIQVGMMVETPGSVFMIDQFAKHADFFSIGSNDLVQYMFAADRTNEKVNYLYQSLHPAVLRAIWHVISSAHAEGKWVSLCGEMATMPAAEPLLLAMGLDEFSVPCEHVLPLRHLIKGLSVRQLQPVLHQSLDMVSASEVEELVKKKVATLYHEN